MHRVQTTSLMSNKRTEIMEKNEKRLVSREDAAEFLRCTQQTVSNWVKNGVLKGHMINGRLFVDSDTLHALTDSVAELEESKRKVNELLEESNATASKLQNDIDDKRAALGLYRGGTASRITRDAIASFLKSLGDVLPEKECDVLIGIVESGDVAYVADNHGLSEERTVQIANKACKRIRHAKCGKIIEENYHLKKRLSELERENNSLRNGIVPPKSTLRNPILDKRIADCDFSVRTINCLIGMGIDTVEKLAASKKTDILKYRNVGKKTICEIEDFAKIHGINIG